MKALRALLGLVSMIALGLAAATWVSGGFTTVIAGVRVSSRDPLRPLLVALVFASGYAWLGGRHAVARDIARSRAALTGARLAALLALATIAVALAFNEWTAGGSDGFAYISQARLLRDGRLSVPMPLAAAAPWPDALLTLTPLGYRPAPTGLAIVPMTAPGLAVLMAALQSVAGHCAAFWVAPLAAGLMVWATFLVGRHVGTTALGLGAAWLLATSPTLLVMAKSTMSDVPASAFWALALAGLLARSLPAAAIAGLSASVAILIRPNLVPLAAAFALWSLWQDLASAPRRPARTLVFALAVVPGALLVAWFNALTYGSPLSSGYGDLSHIFSWSHVPTNAARFLRWLIDTQSPVAVLGLVAPFIALLRAKPAAPARPVSPVSPVSPPDARARRGAVLLALTTLVVWGVYLAYTPWDAWWFLRFLLPAWPALCVGTAAVVLALGTRAGRRGPALAAAALVLIGLNGVRVAVARGVYPPGEGERRYGTIAALVRDATEPDAIILTAQHSGSIRYYAGRLTLRFDVLDPAWLDRAVEWCAHNGHHPYFLIEDWERPAFERRFAAGNAHGRLQMAPVLAYRAHLIPGTILLYDPLRPDGPTLRPPPIANPRPKCVPPAPESAPPARPTSTARRSSDRPGAAAGSAPAAPGCQS